MISRSIVSFVFTRMVVIALMQIAVVIIVILSFFKVEEEKIAEKYANSVLLENQYLIEDIKRFMVLGNSYGVDLTLLELKDQNNLEDIDLLENIEVDESCISKGNNYLCKLDNVVKGISPVVIDKKNYFLVATKKNINGKGSRIGEIGKIAIVTILVITLLNIFLAVGFVRKVILKQILSLKDYILGNSTNKSDLNTKEFQDIIDAYDLACLELTNSIEEKIQLKSHKKLAKEMAHDVRAPLSALEVCSSLIEDSPVEAKSILDLSISRIQSIVDDLGNKVLNTAHTQTTLFVKNLELQASALCIKNSMSLELVNNLKENHKLNISHNYLMRGILNILNNAIEASSSGDSIKIEIYSDNNLMTIKINDEGKGVPQDVLSRIGEYGFSYGKRTGNGIGIAAIKEKVEYIGGNINISSKENIGTSVEVIVPIDLI